MQGHAEWKSTCHHLALMAYDSNKSSHRASSALPRAPAWLSRTAKMLLSTIDIKQAEEDEQRNFYGLDLRRSHD
jgi:hypothetical protein